MGVDFYVCHNCGETFPDCGEYVSCEDCGTTWCCEECAEEEGFVKEHCIKYDVFGYRDLEDERRTRNCKNECDVCCEFYVPDSCKFCREEDYEDYVLLNKALKLLNMTREDLVKKMNEEIRSIVK